MPVCTYEYLWVPSFQVYCTYVDLVVNTRSHWIATKGPGSSLSRTPITHRVTGDVGNQLYSRRLHHKYAHQKAAVPDETLPIRRRGTAPLATMFYLLASPPSNSPIQILGRIIIFRTSSDMHHTQGSTLEECRMALLWQRRTVN
jgi:hypothetical protein